MNRRDLNKLLLAGAAIVGLAGTASLEGCATDFSKIQGYVAAVDQFVDKLAPIVISIDPSQAGQIANWVKEIDAAAAAIAAMSGPAAGQSTAQVFVTIATDVLSVAVSLPGLPPDVVAILSSVQLLIATVAAFFGVTGGPVFSRERAARISVVNVDQAYKNVKQWNNTH